MACSLGYTTSITGACSPSISGSVDFQIYGSAPTLSLSGITGGSSTGVFTTSSTATTFSVTGLSAGTYSYLLWDSCSSGNTYIPISIYISSGTCATISNMKNTECGENNGSITAQTSYDYGISTFALYGSHGFITSAQTDNISYIFNNLSADTYYVVANDGGGCTGKTESCIIKSSITLNYGFFVVNTTPCNSEPSSGGLGKIFVTGLTGLNPYTYQWRDEDGNNLVGKTGSTITGLTEGVYQVLVTDARGCTLIKATTINKVPSLGISSIQIDKSPNCFIGDGIVTVFITGGTGPFYYETSNGDVLTTFSKDVTFTGISNGLFEVSVTDAGLCTTTQTKELIKPSSFYIQSITKKNASCNGTGGEITAKIGGGGNPWTYSLSGASGTTQTFKTDAATQVFSNLSSGVYKLEIKDSLNKCTYTEIITITNTITFNLSAQTSGNTCNSNNGAVRIITSGGSKNFEIVVNGQTSGPGVSAYTFSNLASGTYIATATDKTSNCIQTINFNIPTSNAVDFSTFSIPTVNGNDGVIYVYVNSGSPPFTLTGSTNLNGQTTSPFTGLSASTYIITVTDASGCTKTRSIVLGGNNSFNKTHKIFICSGSTFQSGGLAVRNARQMLLEGFYDLTSGGTNCQLLNSSFTIISELSGVSATSLFYTGKTFDDYPSDSEWASAVTQSLESFKYMGEVVFDVKNNSIRIISDCNSALPLMDKQVLVYLKIEYEIDCDNCPP